MRAGKAVALLTGTTFLGQGLLVAISPILSRLYGPSDFAVLGVFGTLLTTLVVVASLSYERAINVPKDEEDAAALLQLCLWIVLGMSLASALLVGLAGPWISKLAGASHAAPYLWVLPLSLLGAGAYQALNYWAVRRRGFGAVAQTKVHQSLGQAGVQLGAGALSVGPAGLVVGDAVGRIAGATRLWRFAMPDALQRVSRAKLREVAHQYRRFPLYASGAALLHTAASVLPVILFGNQYGEATMAQYTFMQRLITAPITVVGVSVAQVFLSRAGQLLHDSPKDLPALVRKTLVRLSAVGVAVIGIAAIGGGSLFAAIFGATWTEAGVFVRLTALGLFFQFVVGPILSLLHLLEKQRWLLLADAVGFAMVVGSIVGPRQAGLDARGAMIWFSVATAAMYGLLGLLCWVAVQEKAR